MRDLPVDGDRSFRALMGALIGARGHHVREASSASGALAALGTSEFEVMFTGLRIGREDGLVLFGRAREK